MTLRGLSTLSLDYPWTFELEVVGRAFASMARGTPIACSSCMADFELARLTLGVGVLMVGCMGGTPASQLANAPEFAPVGQAKCSIQQSESRPLIVEWPPADRASLEARVGRGLVAVRYDGCEMEVLEGCSAEGRYGYFPTALKKDVQRISTADELYARLPVGAARLEGKLEQSGQLTVEMNIVGEYSAVNAQVSEQRLRGRCADATHVVTSVTVGAFEFFAGGSAAVGGGVALGAEIGGESRATKEMLFIDGDVAACGAGTLQDGHPPAGCSALLRVSVTPLPEAEARLAREREARERREAAEERHRRLRPLVGASLLQQFPLAASSKDGAFTSDEGHPCRFNGDPDDAVPAFAAWAGLRTGLAQAWDVEATARYRRVIGDDEDGDTSCTSDVTRGGPDWSFPEGSGSVNSFGLQGLAGFRPLGFNTVWRLAAGGRLGLDLVEDTTYAGDDRASYSSTDVLASLVLGTGVYLGSNETLTLDLLVVPGWYVTGQDQPGSGLPVELFHYLAGELQLGLAF